MTTENAAKYCASLGMTLYEIDDSDSYNGLKAFINSAFSMSMYFIGNGKKNAQGNFNIFTSQGQFYDQLNWVGENITKNECMNFIRDDERHFLAATALCSQPATFMCQKD